jgi:hypothetical protein
MGLTDIGLPGLNGRQMVDYAPPKSPQLKSLVYDRLCGEYDRSLGIS